MTRFDPVGPLKAALRPLVDTINAALAPELGRDPFARDPRVVRALHPMMRLVNLYFGTEVRGWEHLPADGPFLVIGNHSGGAETNDLWFFLDRWVTERGPEAPCYALAYDLLFAYAPFATTLRRLGVVPASRANARRAIELGAAVVVFPGGDYEVFRPWRDRNRIAFGGHSGFVEVALETGVPVVPMTIHGAHESTFVLTRGRRLAHGMGIDRLHVNVFPLTWNLPLGVMPAFVPSVQLPAKVTVQLGPPFDWSACGPGAADDPLVVRRCYEEVTAAMQATLDALSRERPHPVLGRVDALRPSRIVRRWLGGG